MAVIPMKRRCPKCDATLLRRDKKWWCLICRKYVKP